MVKNLKLDFYIEKIFGGKLLCLAGNEFVIFYDWEGEQCIGKIDVEMEEIFWNKNSLIIKNKNSIFRL